MVKLLFGLLLIMIIPTNANAFFDVDKNDYSSVEKAFKTETLPLFQYKFNKFCKGGMALAYGRLYLLHIIIKKINCFFKRIFSCSFGITIFSTSFAIPTMPIIFIKMDFKFTASFFNKTYFS